MDKIILKFNKGFNAYVFTRNGLPNNLALDSDQKKLAEYFSCFIQEFPKGIEIDLKDLVCQDGNHKKIRFINFDQWYLKLREITPAPIDPKTILAAYLFPNNMVAVFDVDKEQVGQLQGEYTEELHHKILKYSNENTQFNGFPEIASR